MTPASSTPEPFAEPTAGPMTLQVDHVQDAPQVYRFEAKPAWWDGRRVAGLEGDYEFTLPPRFELTAHAMGENLHLQGVFEAEIEIDCARCSARYRQPLRESFRLVLEPAGDRKPGERESAEALVRDGLCLGDDLELGWYRGARITLDSWFSEIVSLALPVQPLCDEDCAGLCVHCGVARGPKGGEASCRCEEEEQKRRSPFAVLADWKPAGDAGEGSG